MMKLYPNLSECRYLGMLESSQLLLVHMNRAGELIFANQAFCKLVGMSFEELSGRVFSLMLHPEDVPAACQAIQVLSSSPHLSTIELRVTNIHDWCWINWEFRALQENQADFDEIQALGHDITRQKLAEAELSSQKTLLSSMIKAFPDIFWLKNCQGAYLGCNPGYADFVQKPVEGIIGQFDSDLFDRDTAERLYKGDQELVHQREKQVVAEWSRLPDGQQVLLETLKAPLMDSHGSVIGLFGMSRDVTAWKRKEENAIIERNLAIVLAQQTTSAEALPFCLDLVLQVSEMDCGGIYMLERKSQDLVMAVHIGLSDEYIANYKRFIQGSEQYQLVMKGDTIYQQHLDALVKDPIIENEGLHCLGLIPLHSKNKVVACIQVASHTHNTIPPSSRDTLEGLSVHIGSLIARFQVQDELAESQNELKSLFDSLQDFVFVLDEQGNILQVNQLVLNRLGYGRQELIGRNVVEIHPREERRLAWQSVQDMLAGLKDTCLLNLLRTDGLPVPVETKVVRGRWGTRDALIEVSRDITERKAAEQAQNLQQALLEYRRHFEEILTNISMHLINFTGNDIDPEINDVLRQIGEFEQVDRSYVFLINRQTALMKNTHEWYAPGIEPQIHQLQNLPTNMFPWGMEKLEKLEEVYIPVISELPSEAQIEREILETKAIQSILVVPLVSQNIMTGFLGFDSVTRQRTWSTDSILLIKMVGNIISNTLMRAQMENDLRQSEERTRALLSAIPDLIFRVRRDGIVLDYKAGSNELLAIPPDQVVGSSMAQVFNKYMAEKSMVCMEHALQRKEIQTMEYNLKIDDSSHVVEARFINSGADEVIAMVRDISGRARLEQMKSDFINKATHELRTPIATMLLMASLIDGSSSSEEFEEYWEVLKGELDREQILVEDLLTAGRLESDQVELHFQNLDIRELIQQVVQHMQPTAREKDITITPPKSSELFDFPMYIQADESALAQAFINLLNNAIKFTPYGGQVEVLLQRANSGYEVSIIDNGIGIPSEDLPLLFSRFFRGSNAIKNEIPGTGIGLFIVRSIVEKHGGRIKVLSELNNGSQFDIWLPRVETELDYYNFL